MIMTTYKIKIYLTKNLTNAHLCLEKTNKYIYISEDKQRIHVPF